MWHFSGVDKKLRYNDERVIKVGKTLKVKGPVELCERGLHASKRLIDALKFAPGPYVWFVELSGEVVHGEDKSVATERTALWGFDATDVLRKFSRKVALEAIEQTWNEDKFGAFPEVVKKWLKTGDESLRSAAESAAWSAAESAAWSAAESAAWSAAESAAWSAAESAAWSAAESAARSAARSAAWSAARSAQDTKLRAMLNAAKRKAEKK
jgi:hypothetical protein